MTMRSIMKTAGRVGRVVIAAAAMIGYSSMTAGADTSSAPDPMRCEALKLRCDSRYHMCLSHCDGIADRRASRSVETAEELRDSCSNACDLRHYRSEVRLEQRPVCKSRVISDPETANTQACAAKLLWVKANYMQCMGRCHARSDRRPAFDCDGCASGCYDRYRADTDAANSDAICGEGPAEAVPVEPQPSACTVAN